MFLPAQKSWQQEQEAVPAVRKPRDYIILSTDGKQRGQAIKTSRPNSSEPLPEARLMVPQPSQTVPLAGGQRFKPTSLWGRLFI